jgi:hypothetical protein
MAQVCGGTTFDFEASRKHDAALKILSRAADIWAAGEHDSLSVDSVVAVLLQIFLSKCNVREEIRTLDSWLPLVTTAREQIETFFPAANPATVAETLTMLQAEVSEALEQWSLGNPEQPPTIHALNSFEHILFIHKFTTRPANPKFPKTLLSN